MDIQLRLYGLRVFGFFLCKSATEFLATQVLPLSPSLYMSFRIILQGFGMLRISGQFYAKSTGNTYIRVHQSRCNNIDCFYSLLLKFSMSQRRLLEGVITYSLRTSQKLPKAVQILFQKLEIITYTCRIVLNYCTILYEPTETHLSFLYLRNTVSHVSDVFLNHNVYGWYSRGGNSTFPTHIFNAQIKKKKHHTNISTYLLQSASISSDGCGIYSARTMPYCERNYHISLQPPYT